ncbi:hypothetical protein BDZ89DRAFT_1140170 [Hymenopellis radicata]|nr:hypothetical protein BDZ89DRAFT_1140170 [Hymenopellis radicata]
MSVDELRHSRKHRSVTSSSSKTTSRGPVHLTFHSRPAVEHDSKSKLPDPPPSTKISGCGDEPINSALLYRKGEKLEDTWDGYPDGDFTLDITHDVFAKTRRYIWPLSCDDGASFP